MSVIPATVKAKSAEGCVSKDRHILLAPTKQETLNLVLVQTPVPLKRKKKKENLMKWPCIL
jgi:hypothetical protein